MNPRCKKYRKRILEMSQKVSALHAPSAFSCLEIIDTIYHDLMRWNPDGTTPDTFLISKGHGWLSQAVILEDLGIWDRDVLDSYCTPQGMVGAHPDYGVPGIEASTGSLGHGLGMAVGMAKADQILGHDRRIFVVISDGEGQEGSTWEAAAMAPNLKLTNLMVFMDWNNYQSMGQTSDSHPYFDPMDEKWRSWGWNAVDIKDGHDQETLLAMAQSMLGKGPAFLACHTIKGKGVSYMTMDGTDPASTIWHFRSPNPEEYAVAIADIEAA